MNEITLFKEGDKNITISSKEIAELTGKLHYNVLRDCDILNDNYLKMNITQIRVVEEDHPVVTDRKVRVMYLTKMQTMDLLTGYNHELRIRVNRRWEELEAKEKVQIPQTFSEALALAASQAKALELKEAELKKQEPKVRFANSVIKSEDNISMNSMAKIIGLGRNKLFSSLREDKVLMSDFGNKNIPYQKYINAGYFEVTEKVLGSGDIVQVTLVTPKGQIFIASRYGKNKTEK